MSPTDVDSMRRMLEAYYEKIADHYRRRGEAGPMTVATEDLPEAMRLGEEDDDGWVAWRLVPSTLTTADVEALEREIGATFPPAYRAYLLASSHLFDVHAAKYDQQVLLPSMPSNDPLGPLRAGLPGDALLDAGLIPFASWGDGWGPMCFDTTRRSADGECPVLLGGLGEDGCRDRARVEPLLRPLYASSRELLEDLFGS